MDLLPPVGERGNGEVLVAGTVLHLRWDQGLRLYDVHDAHGEFLFQLDVPTYPEARAVLLSAFRNRGLTRDP